MQIIIRFVVAAFGIIATTTIACAQDAPASTETARTEMDSTALPPGRWMIPAHGLIMERSDSETIVYAMGGSICAEIGRLRGPDAADIHIIQTPEGPVLLQGVTRYPAQVLAALPAHCTIRPTRAAPDVTFDALWAVFAESYPFFSARSVDWGAFEGPQYIAWQERSAAARTDDALWALFTEMLAPLRDSHISLTRGEQRWSQSRNVRATTADPDGIIPNGRALHAGLLAWLRSPQSPLIAPPVVDAGGYLLSGVTRSGHCYLAVLEMTDYAGDDATETDNETVLADALDRVASRCAATASLIVDLRYNPGGDDRHGIAIAARVARASYTAYTKRAFGPAGWTTAYPVIVTPSERPSLPSRVAVLIGPRTISAAETTALALRSAGSATLIGANAQGALSDILMRVLPNGWTLTLSNEEYAAPDGTVFEGVGVPPDVRIEEPTTSITARFGTAIIAAETALANPAERH